MSTINIIDTSQLINDAGIIEALVSKGKKVYVPTGVTNELNNHINGNDLNKAKRSEFAIKLIDKNQNKLDFSFVSGVNADSSIQQIILSQLGRRKIDNINVYTFDQNLAKMCRSQNNNPTIKHNCCVEAYQYENGTETLTPEKPEDFGNMIKFMDGGELWRDDNYVSEFCTDSSYLLPVSTDLGNMTVNVIKYWAWHVKAYDYYKLYKRVDLSKGDRITTDVLTFDNTCDVYARICAYNTKTGKACGYDSKYLTAGKWRTLSLEVDGSYDYINIEFFPKNDSQGDELWNGMDGYINCIRLERHHE